MRKMAADFRVLGTVVLLPVVVLAGVAVWGLGAQRRAALADAQGQARAVAQRMSSASRPVMDALPSSSLSASQTMAWSAV
jgi:hypothetical protein